MSRTSDKLTNNKLTLIVSLPDNALDMAKICEKNGADAIKVHINVQHSVSGRKFGNFDQEKYRLEQIIKSVTIPVGIVPGEDLWMSDEEIKRIASLGFDYIDVFAHFMPATFLYVDGIGKEVAIDGTYDLRWLRAFDVLPVDAIDAAIIGPEGYRKRLSVADLLRYKAIVEATAKPVVVPSDRMILPSDVKALANIGVKGLMIGVASTGMTLESLESSVREFRNAINAL